MTLNTLFRSQRARANTPDPATTKNEAGGIAYERSPRLALATYATTGCLAATFYADAQAQLDKLLSLAEACGDPHYVAQVAAYARKHGHMKDAPVVLAAWVLGQSGTLFADLAPHVLDNGKQVRSFVQVLRSGQVKDATGKALKNLPQPARRYLRAWLTGRKAFKLRDESVGDKPSLGDVVKMVHPKPRDAEQAGMFAWLVGKEPAEVPVALQHLLRFRRMLAGDLTVERCQVPNGVEHRLLTSLPLTKEHWIEIGMGMPWHALRMNLNTLTRKGAFEDERLLAHACDKLRDAEAISKARVMPYQLMAAYINGDGLHAKLRLALQDALDLAVANVPALPDNTVVVVDVSGSMGSPLTGQRGSATTKVRCVDVAALVASAVLRRNPLAKVLAVDTSLHDPQLNPRDSVVTNATKLARYGGGGTALGVAFQALNEASYPVDLVWVVSDSESWADRASYFGYYNGGRATAMAGEWAQIKTRCPKAKLVVHDLQPIATSQVQEKTDVLHVAGFSDAVFEIVRGYAEGTDWVAAIEAVDLRKEEGSP